MDDTLLLIKPSNVLALLKLFNKFDKNLKFTVDIFPEGIVHFLDIKKNRTKQWTLRKRFSF